MKRVAGLSALTGSGIGVLIMAGYAIRAAYAIGHRSNGWHDVKDFLGIGGRK